MRPPSGPAIIDHLFGLSFLTVRWYGVLIVSGAILAGYLAARRARAHGIDDDHVWNQLLLGMLFGIICARIYYVAFEWPRYAGRCWRSSIPRAAASPSTGRSSARCPT